MVGLDLVRGFPVPWWLNAGGGGLVFKRVCGIGERDWQCDEDHSLVFGIISSRSGY